MFDFGGGSMDNLMAVVGAMDMVAGDVAATADETGEEVGMTRADRRNDESGQVGLGLHLT